MRALGCAACRKHDSSALKRMGDGRTGKEGSELTVAWRRCILVASTQLRWIVNVVGQGIPSNYLKASWQGTNRGPTTSLREHRG